nr:response regulator [Bradyrhizobium sp. 141]
MRALTTTAVTNALVRAFPASSLQAYALKQLVLFCGAVLFVWLLSTTYGLDLSAGFF